MPPSLLAALTAKTTDTKIRISGTCKHNGPCNIRIRATDEATATVDDASALDDAVNEVWRRLQQQRGGSAQTFAIGVNGVTRYNFELRVVDASQLVVSNDPFTFAINPRYPAELQPRDRDRSALKSQVEKIAANLSPDALIEDFRTLDRGTPIAGPDLVVEGGNGRTMALIRAAADFPDSFRRYRDRLTERLPEFGLDPGLAHELETPVLVRIRLSQVDRKAFAAETNTPPGISSSAIEDAQTDAKAIGADFLRQLQILDDESIEDALRATRNARIVSAFLASLPERDVAQLLDSDGRINMEGIRRLTLAIFLAAFPGETGVKLAELAFESIDLQVRNIVSALARSLAQLATAEALIGAGERDADLAIGADIAAAVTTFSRIKSTPGMDVQKYLDQIPLFERELTPFQERILLAIDERSRSSKRLAAVFVAYANGVIQAPPPQQGQLIPGAAVTKEQLWAQALREQDVPEPATLFAALLSERRAPDGSIDIYKPEVAGPFAWAQLHSWANNIRDFICPTCGEFAVKAARALHDLVNLKLGKPLKTPDEFAFIAGLFARALNGDPLLVGEEHARLHENAEAEANSKVGESIRKQISRPVLMRLGAHDFVDSPTGTAFSIKHNRRQVLAKILVDLQADDTYTVSFYLLSTKTYQGGIVESVQGVLARELDEAILALYEHNIEKPVPANAKLALAAHLRRDAIMVDFSSGRAPHEVVADPSLFDAFRADVADDGAHINVYGCPAGKFDRSANDCTVQGQLQAIIHPPAEESMLEREALESGTRVGADGAVQEATPSAIMAFIQSMIG